MANDFQTEFSRLNVAQKLAVDTIDGPVAVIAGPGTGKTQLLSLRVANILKQTDTAPSNILCLTFTEAAAENIRERLSQFIGVEANFVEIFTFHGFGSSIIQNYPEYFSDSPLLKHLNELGQFELIQSLLSQLHHDNPLSKRYGEDFLHLPSLISTISWLNQAGLSADDLREESIKNKAYLSRCGKFLDTAFASSPTSKQIELYTDLLANLTDIQKSYPSKIADLSIHELETAIAEVDTSGHYAQTITKWRNDWLLQTTPSHWQYADLQKNTFLLHVADLYEKYETKLKTSGFYTYDDMIMRTLEAIKSNQELKLLLQEKYQYVLVDEFQDTNGAQYDLLTLLGDNIINENRPNIMVVGDDDQAIYRFQGAESSIIHSFIEQWDRPEVIVLQESYRSGQKLLDLSRQVIANAEDRLENENPIYSKLLKSAGNENSTEIVSLNSPTEMENYLNVTEVINGLIKKGISPSKISVIAPKHKYIKDLEPYLLSKDIPINYERAEQILHQPRIIEIVDLVGLIWAASNAKTVTLESLLPKVIGAPYFQLKTNEWWELAILAQKDQQKWLSAIETYNNPTLNAFAEMIKALGKDSKNLQFKLILSYLLGNKPFTLADDTRFYLPWREYYFSERRVAEEPYEHLRFIGQLNTLLNYFDEWNADLNKLITIDDFYRFIQVYKASKLPLLDNSPYLSAKEAVTLTTAYKAKGLEWDYVFVLNCHDDVWGSKARSRNLTFRLPSSLRWIEPARINSNDLIRLFYVGITRAKKCLYLTTYEYKDSGHLSASIPWLESVKPELIKQKNYKQAEPSDVNQYFQKSWENKFNTPTEDLAVILKPMLANYRLSATHLNNFLAVDKGGPRYFLMKSLLRISDLTSTNVIYGQAIHKTLEFTHSQLNVNKKLPDINEINNFFTEDLKTYPLTSTEYRFLKKRGFDNLNKWLEINKQFLSPDDISEHDFARENIAVGKARLTGKIDVLRKVDKNHLNVIDYKTSQPIYSWKGGSGLNAIKSYTYQKQLMFYKLLVDNSSLFRGKYQIDKGQINFISPDAEDQVIILDYDFDKEALARYQDLIEIVWEKIMNLDLPDVSKYPANITGIRSFEEDLLNHEI